MIKLTEIRAHELLDSTQRDVCWAMAKHSREAKHAFDWLKYAEINLKGTATNYVENTNDMATLNERDLKRAAVLYVYEALRACDIPIIKEWPEFDEMLKNLGYLMGDLP
jgi:hypothetical protein